MGSTERRGCIYVLHCLVTDKKYVGKVLKTTAEKRWASHINCSNIDKPRILLHKAIKKYGVENFSAEVVQHNVDASKLNDAESRWVKRLGTLVPGGYNLTLGGDGSYGFKHNAETRRKMSAKAKEVWQRSSHQKLMSQVHTGQTHTPESRSRISKSLLGRTVSDEIRAKISTGNKAHVANIARLRRGVHRTPHSEESKAKMVIAQKLRWARASKEDRAEHGRRIHYG